MWLSVSLQLWIFLLSVLPLVYWYIRSQFSFWAKQGVPFRKPHWFFGNIGDWVRAKTSMADTLVNIYQEFRSERFCGIWRFFAPTLFAIDPEFIRHITVKDCETWSMRGLPFDPDDPLSATLVNLNGDEWKSMRSSLSPAYTPGKLKRVFQLLLQCGKNLKTYLNDQLAANDHGLIEAGEMCRGFVVDVSGFAALGIRLNSLNENNPFHEKFNEELTLKKKIILLMRVCSTRLFKLLKLRMETPEMTDFFVNFVKQNMEHRDKNNIQEHDFLDLLRSLRSKDVDYKLLAAQAFDFFLGGFETSSRSIGYALHELAVNEDIQDRLREEVRITKAANNGEITWDALNNMKYLHMVVQGANPSYPVARDGAMSSNLNMSTETLRKYPIPLVLRMSAKPYRIPDTNVELPSGTMCFIPIYAIHHDPEYYPDPDKFDPERFTHEAKSQRPSNTFLPFGAGPRNCIGLRLGEHQMKVALITVVDNFKLSLCEKSKHPVEFDPEDVLLTPKEKLWLRVSKNSPN